MRILLIGEYSNVHWTLAEGLRELGHEVVVASNGDGWKNYPRNYNLRFSNNFQKIGCLADIFVFKKFSGFDVVQFINHAEAISFKNVFSKILFFNILKKSNKSVFLGAFGDDFYWVDACLKRRFKYSQFDRFPLIDKENESHFYFALNYLSSENKKINSFFAEHSDAIISGLYEYNLAYKFSPFDIKLTHINFPINLNVIDYHPNILQNNTISIFFGIQKKRTAWKGTDILLDIISKYRDRYPNDIKLQKVENVPFAEYKKLINSSNIVVDQLYSYSPGMNGLLSMAKGKILMGGGEDEIYTLYGETENKPILNVIPDEKQIISQLDYILDNKLNIEEMGLKSREFIEKYHDYKVVAQQYVDVWTKYL